MRRDLKTLLNIWKNFIINNKELLIIRILMLDKNGYN